MSSVLKESLNILRPHLPEALFDHNAVSKIWRTAEYLAPVPRIGFECRLGAGKTQVDLQQGITADETNLLIEHVRRILDLGANPDGCWNELDSFCRLWSDSSTVLAKNVQEIWLEFDLLEGMEQGRVPSIFVGLKSEQSSRLYSREAAGLTARILWNQSLTSEIEKTLDRCFARIPDVAHVCHFGMMIPRPLPAVRIIIKGMNGAQAIHYLSECGWPGSLEDLRPTLEFLHELFDDVRVCLDIGDDVYSHIGLECFHSMHSDLKSKRNVVLDAFTTEGWCSEEKKAALLSWSGTLTPVDASEQWPAEFVVQSLTRNPAEFSHLFRTINHFKITWSDKNTIEAKSYLGFGHVWVDPHAHPTE